MTVASAGCDGDKPRVIFELKKNACSKRRLTNSSSLDDARPKIAGELLWSATPTQWHVKLAEVRHGSLVVHCCATGEVEFRFPLHHLNLQAGHTPRTFTLTTSYGIPLATFQTSTEEEYQRWVRVIAVEVLRQTPLQDVRFLDIIGITRREEGLRRGRSEECLSQGYHKTAEAAKIATRQKTHRMLNKSNFRDECSNKKEKTEFSQWLHCVKRETEEENREKNMDFDIKNMKIRRAQRVRPKLPFAETWSKLRSQNPPDNFGRNALSFKNRSVSMDDLRRNQTQSMLMQQKEIIRTNKLQSVSDESGISSGDENNNTISESSTAKEITTEEESIYVSVREKKQFFESLSEESGTKRGKVSINRSSSIGYIDLAPPLQQTLRRGQRASSMQDLSGNVLPVKEIRRFFESGSANDLTKSYEELRHDEDAGSTIMEEDEGDDEFEKQKAPKESQSESISEETTFVVQPVERKAQESVSYANIQIFRTPESLEIEAKCPENKINDSPAICVSKNSSNLIAEPNDNVHYSVPVRKTKVAVVTDPNPELENSVSNQKGDMPLLLAQRKLQRGERKLGKLRIQIAEVEDTIKHIAEDLYSIGPNTLKRRSGLEVFAALRRRLEEETSRLERLQEETARVISDNQKTIKKMNGAVPN